jgi:ribosomal-protein-alanine N-acetyltransferase
MHGVEEMHLLNITVAPARQGQGWGHMMLDALSLWSRSQGAKVLWLEVRQSNARALHVYERYGFRRVGLRKDYYPLDRQKREHAVVMSLPL